MIMSHDDLTGEIGVLEIMGRRMERKDEKSGKKPEKCVDKFRVKGIDGIIFKMNLYLYILF